MQGHQINSNQLGFLEVWVGARAPNQLKPNSKFPEVSFWCKGTKIETTFKVSGSLVWCKGTKFEPRSIILKLVGARVLIKIVVKEFWCKGIKSQKAGVKFLEVSCSGQINGSVNNPKVLLSYTFVSRWPELGVRLQNNVASRACASFSNGVASRAIAYF